MTISVENLYKLSDIGAKAAILPALIGQLKASPSVRGVFFNAAEMPVPPVDAGFMDEVAVTLACSAIAHSSLYAFGTTVHQAKCDANLQSQLGSPQMLEETQHLYAWAFPQHCQADGHSFAEYLYGDAARWAAELTRYVTAPEFVNGHLRRMISDEIDWLQRLNLVFYKLSLLDRSTVAPVLDAWKKAFPRQGVVENWQTSNVVPKTILSGEEFLLEVNVAISETRHVDRRQTGQHVWHDSFLHGERAAAFVGSDTPRVLGLTSGREPENKTSRLGGSPAYFVAGTPIHLADGGTMQIEKVRAEHEVLAQQGDTGRLLGAQVVRQVDQKSPLYGLNDVAPFFSAGHAFLTQDGWKAIDPELAHADNPGRNVGKLEVGDVLMRVNKTDPSMYDEVAIQRINTGSIADGTKLYGLHLADVQTYHAHGFCVAMHYPVITENRLTEGFAGATGPERRLIADRMRVAMPLISQALGRSVAQPIFRSLGASAKSPEREGLSRTTRRYTIHLPEDVGSEFISFGEPRQLSLADGKLDIDGRVIEKPEFSQGVLTWNQMTRHGYSAGCLHFTPDCLAFQGVLYQGRTVQSAFKTNVQGTTPPSVYQTKLGAVPGKNPTKTEPGMSVTLGYVNVANQPPQLILKFNAEPSAASVASLQTDPSNQNLQLVVVFNATITPVAFQMVSPLWPASGLIEFSWDGSSFSGMISKYDAAKAQPTTDQFLWTGQSQ